MTEVWETVERLGGVVRAMGGARWGIRSPAKFSRCRGDGEESMAGSGCRRVERWCFQVLFGEVRDWR